MPESLVISVTSQYEVAKTRVTEDSELSEELWIKLEIQKRYVYSPFLCAFVADVVMEITGQ